MSAALEHEPLPARLVAWVSNFANADAQHTRTVDMHPFNAQVECFLPHAAAAAVDVGAVRARLGACVRDACYFEACCSLAELLQPEFLDAHCRNGSRLYAHSVHTPLDSSNVVAILPSGAQNGAAA
jgi:hypothetical protein